MAPGPNYHEEMIAAGKRLAHAPAGEDVCISGLSGTLPESPNVYAFQENLLNKVDMVVENHGRWDMVHPELPKRMGRIYGEEKFDASFFGYHEQQIDVMDCMARLLLEKTYEAIVDAGVNPSELAGTRTAVIIGACSSEKESEIARDLRKPSGYSLHGGSRAAFANKISYWLRVHGPSYTVDSACSSSLYALEHGYRAIRDGLCDQAIVAGANLCLHPAVTLQFSRIGVLSLDGKSKSFDDSANGYVRSESANAVFLQKSRDARRVYATVVYGKTNCDGHKDQGITYPSGAMQSRLLDDFYQECEVEPADLAWVEAHGTGTGVGDPEELSALSSSLCARRSTPLPIGSVKSNIGHTEPASGLCSVTKVIIAMETGLIPPNLHYVTPKRSVPALLSGQLQVVTEPQPWAGGLVGINSFGFGGANCHVLLKSNSKKKINGGAATDKLPRLVTISSRTELGVDQILDELESRPVDTELVRLYQQVHCTEIPGHSYRGFILLKPGKAVRKVEMCELSPTSVWLLLTDEVSDLSNTAKTLLGLPAFAEVVMECHKSLATTGVDLLKVINEGSALKNACHKSVVTTAVQIGLLGVLRVVGVSVDRIAGHSLGNAAAALADNSLTLEQAMATAYFQGLAIQENNMKDLVKSLQKVIPVPKARSSKWLSSGSSSGQHGKLASAEFFAESVGAATASLEAMLRAVPRHAILVEMSTQKESRKTVDEVAKKINGVALTRESTDGIESVLTALGKIYSLGVNMDLATLYPSVAYPVSASTRMISPFIGWDHRRDWHVDYYSLTPECVSCERNIIIVVKAIDNEYLRGHVIDGRNLFPATGYLVLVWETFCLMNKVGFTDCLIVMEEVKFNRATNIPKEGTLQFNVAIQKVSGKFEVLESGVAIVTGRIYCPADITKETFNLQAPTWTKNEPIEMSSRDVYKELNLRGYNYSNLFRSILSADSKGTRGKVRWADNWVAFMDNLLQMQILAEDTRGLFVPTSINKITVDPTKHMGMVLDMEANGKGFEFDVIVNHEAKVIKAGGVEIRGLNASAIARRKQQAEPVLEKYQFVPNRIDFPTKGSVSLSLREALAVCVHTTLENQHDTEIKCIELADDDTDSAKPLLAPMILSILGDLPLIRPAITVFAKPNHRLTQELGPEVRVEESSLNEASACHFVVGSGLARRPRVLHSALINITTMGCILSREVAGEPLPDLPGVNVLCEIDVGDEKIVCIRKQASVVDPEVVKITEGGFGWVSELQAKFAAQQKTPRRILLVAQGEATSGVLGLANCLHKEPGGDNVRCFFIADSSAPKFDPELELYKNQIGLDLLMNVFKDGCWGSYRHLPLQSNPTVAAEHAYVNILTRGDLTSLSWLEGPLRTGNIALKPKEELVQIYFSALNFRDIMTATGKLAAEVVVKGRLNQDCVQGLEFAGRDSQGRRVMGMVAAGAMSSMVVADADLLWDVPDEWTMEDAATVPVVYGTALFALVIAGRMAKGDTILIHAGSGGVGQAAITLALHAGCTVFTTVGTQEKRDFIKRRFPQLTDRQIGNSRDTSFEQLVMTETHGRGVDLVLNSLAEEKLQASVRCLALGGRFLEIGKFDLAANNTIGMEIFAKETSFHGIMLDSMFNASPAAKRQLLDIVKKGIADGAIRPLTRKVFADDDVEQAFRYMAAGKHIGKVLLQIRPEEEQKICVPEIRLKQVAPRFFCDAKHTYVIAGGLGGFGLELADWMILRGARKLVLTSRNGVKTGYQAARVATWMSYGADVRVSTADITGLQGVTALLEQANAMGPVAGIFNLAVVLADALFENQTAETFATSAKPKSDATHFLDAVSRRLCPALAHFVVFSSVSCGRGNAGQTNYGASNSVMERVMEQRVAEGLPGLAIQWGAVGEVGLVAEMQEENYELVIGGTLQQRISSCLQVMERFLRQPHPVVASMVVAEKRSSGGEAGNIVDSVINILGLKDFKSVSLHTTLAELGMDSIMAVEIKQMLERDYEVFLPPQEMRSLTVHKLHELNRLAEEDKKESDAKSAINDGVYVNAFNFMLRAVGKEDTCPMPTTLLPSTGNVGSGDRKTIFLIPGIEGTSSVFEPLAKNLTSLAVGLQLDYNQMDNTQDLPETTVEMAKSLLPHVKKGLSPERPFNLLGYSFGSMVALDLAYLLEKDGYHGEIFLVDGSPDYLQTICRSQLVDGSDVDLQANTIIAILNLIKPQTPSTVEQLRQELLQQDSWDKRLELFMKVVPATGYSQAFVKTQASATLRRVRSIINHTWTHPSKIQSKVTLLRQTYLSVPITEDYGVGKYCEKKVDVHMVEGDHVSILESLQMATIINNQVVNVGRER